MSNTLETLTLVPRGEVQVSKDYGNNTVEYENGTKQFQRRWISPRIVFSFSVQGDKDMKEYLEDFIDEVHGNYSKFLWVYEGVTYTVRFGEKSIVFKDIRGYGGEGVIGYSADITLEVVKSNE